MTSVRESIRNASATLARSAARRALTSRRRGNFFILVVGTLAMLAVITVIYVSVGRADRRTGAAVQQARIAEDIAEQVRDYMLDVIARDLFLPVPVQFDASGTPTAYAREAWDIPTTNSLVTSLAPGETNFPGAAFTLFDPAGVGDDPWLASTEPTYLALGTHASEAVDYSQRWRDLRDWKHISNFAPNGLFVNLANLRGTENENNFDAAPGFGENTPTTYRMSDRLSMYDANDASVLGDSADPVFPFISPFDSLRGTANLDPRFPRDFTIDQRFAFRPMEDDLDPGDPLHIDNQWADADGDGMADSRWFELVDASSPLNDGLRFLLDNRDDLRYFVAARAIDLSGLINVNTAGDFVIAANGDRLPVGLTPSSVDLRRLLGMSDAAYLWFGPSGSAMGYGELYPGFTDEADEPDLGDRREEDYRGFPASTFYDAAAAVGADLENSGTFLGVAPRQYGRYWTNRLNQGGTAADDRLDPANRTITASEDQRSDAYARVRSGPGGTLFDAAGPSFTTVPTFGIGDLTELLRFRASNDPTRTTQLERAFADPFPGFLGNNQPSLGLLRDNRGLDLELFRRGEENDARVPREEALIQFAIDPRQRLTTRSGARLMVPELFAAPAAGETPIAPSITATGSLAKSLRSPDASALFTEIATTLSPTAVWPDATTFEADRFQIYGYASSEVAVRLAAHLTANMIDSRDRAVDSDELPTILTLALTDDAVDRDLTNESWAGERLTSPVRATAPAQLTDVYASTANAFVNVYGIEAQPFISEIASFWIFTDAPADNSGNSSGSRDEEWMLDNSDPMNPILMTGPVTIELDVSTDDFLMHGVVVQLANPFSEDINLSSSASSDEATPLADEDDFEYYIEIEGVFYKLVNLQAWQADEQYPAVLRAGESRNVVLMSESPFVGDLIDQRFQDIDDDYTATGSDVVDVFPGVEFAENGFGLSWLKSQFKIIDSIAGAGQSEPIIAVPFTPTSGSVLNPLPNDRDGVLDSTIDDEVRLWRAIRSGANEDVSNEEINDYLADRFRIPAAAGFDRLASASTTHSGTLSFGQAGPDPSSGDYDDAEVEDNTGATLVLSTRVNRRYAIDGPGEIPLYALEASDAASALAKESEPSPDGDDRPDYDNPNGWNIIWGGFLLNTIEERFLVDAGGGAGVGFGAELAIRDITRPADDKSGAAPSNLSADPWAALKVEYRPRDLAFNEFLDAANTQTSREFATTRLVNVLLSTPAIGAWYYPAVSGGGPDQWTTLGESIAIALDFERPMAEVAGSTPMVPIMAELGRRDDAVTPAIRPQLENAKLVLNDFVPFIDNDGSDGFFTPNSTDVATGLGIPIALGLVDRFTMLDDDDVSQTRPVQGLININPAPYMVLRQLPMFAPTPVSSGGLLTAGFNEWWWPTTSTNQHDATTDVAAGVIAYRDRSMAGVWQQPTGNSELDFTSLNAFDPTIETARGYAAGIPGLRDREGFRSVGELLMVRNGIDDADGSGPLAFQFSVDRLGRDNINVANASTDANLAIAIEGNVYDDGSGTSFDPDNLIDDRDEQLAILSAAAQSVTVRSDYFAVWFVVRGYSEADVTGLEDQDPMIPTVNRRFLMIVDRSNVTSPGQKPRVLSFEEVPVVGTFGSIGQ